jgi:hypothetical protein
MNSTQQAAPEIRAHAEPEKTGNRCGHDPERPRWFAPPEKHKARPKIIQKAIDAIRAYYASPASILPALNACNESDRQQRSERRESCIALMAVILHYTDLVTLRVGIPQADGSMAGIRMSQLAELAGLNERRAERAIADMKDAGIVTVHRICEKIDDLTYKGYAAIRAVSRKLFDVFGLGLWLQHERRKAKDRWERRFMKQKAKDAANVAMAMNAKLNQELHELKRQQGTGPEPAKPRGLTPVASHCLQSMRQALGRGPKDSS